MSVHFNLVSTAVKHFLQLLVFSESSDRSGNTGGGSGNSFTFVAPLQRVPKHSSPSHAQASNTTASRVSSSRKLPATVGQQQHSGIITNDKLKTESTGAVKHVTFTDQQV